MNMRVLSIGVGIPLALAIVCAVGLKFVRPDLFPLEWVLPATCTFFAQFGLLALTLMRRGKRIDEKQIKLLLDESKSRQNAASYWLGDFAIFSVFLALGVVAGTISGGVWWAAGGNTIRSLSEALIIGAFFGGGAMLILFGGV
jgi:hypothetical protein